MDQVVHREGCDEEAKGCVDTVSPSDSDPCGPEALSGLCAIRGILGMPFGATNGTFCLVCGGELDDVGDEKMARNEEIENKTEK